MISPSDNNTKELQSNDNVSRVTVSSSSTSREAKTGKQKMKVAGMPTHGGGVPIGQGACITLQKLKFRGGSIQSKKVYCQEHSTTASTPSITSSHSPQAGPSNDSSYDSKFITTQYSSSSEERSEESAISSKISSNESFENLVSNSTQSTTKRGNKNQPRNQGYRPHIIRVRGPRVTNNRTPRTQQTQYNQFIYIIYFHLHQLYHLHLHKYTTVM